MIKLLKNLAMRSISCNWSSVDLAERELKQREEGERQKQKGWSGGWYGLCKCVSGWMEGWGGLWEKQNLLFFFQLIPYDRLIAFLAKREKRRTTKPWEIQKVKCTRHHLLTLVAFARGWQQIHSWNNVKKRWETWLRHLCNCLGLNFKGQLWLGKQFIYIYIYATD